MRTLLFESDSSHTYNYVKFDEYKQFISVRDYIDIRTAWSLYLHVKEKQTSDLFVSFNI